MTAEEIMQGDDPITVEMIKSLSLPELRKLGTELFEFKGISRASKEELQQKCINVLEEEFKAQRDAQNRQTANDFVSDEQNQVNAIILAKQIKAGFKGWFTAEELRQRMKISYENRLSEWDGKDKDEEPTPPPTIDELNNRLEILRLFKLCKKDVKYKKRGSITKYRINLAVVERAIQKQKAEKKAAELEAIKEDK